MIIFDTRLLLFAILLFCRVGACIMVMPGFSAPRVPAQVRLFIAIAVTLSLMPILLDDLRALIPAIPGPAELATLILAETLIGVSIGLLGRFFFLALQFMGVALASHVGLAGMIGPSVDEADPVPAVGSIVTMTATVLFFISDLHWEVFRGIIASYDALPIAGILHIDLALSKLTDVLAQAFILALQITSPFIIFSTVINFTFGIVNKLTPQIPVYFISMPFVIAGGMLLLYFAMADFMRIFMTVLKQALENG